MFNVLFFQARVPHVAVAYDNCLNTVLNSLADWLRHAQPVCWQQGFQLCSNDFFYIKKIE